MSTEAMNVQELEAQLEEWQAELDRLENWPETRLEYKERIEALREKLHWGAERLREWRDGGPWEIP
jgi:DNA repair ATPase RecN